MAKRKKQKPNRRNLKHGIYIQPNRSLRKTRRAMAIFDALLTSLGGKGFVPDQQEILLWYTAIKIIEANSMGALILNGKTPPTMKRNYITWTKEIRHDLKVLGLKRIARDVTQDLKTYIASAKALNVQAASPANSEQKEVESVEVNDSALANVEVSNENI